jgi:phosphoenolpyruvate-protein kinase (PTS system EI component)
VLQCVERAISAARAASIRSVVCGEMAATPAYALVLIGLGARELSMAPSSIPRVRRAVSAVSAEAASTLARECLECAGADDAEELVRARLGGLWPDLFPPETLPPPKNRG